jgi:hypothetical protein
MKVHDVVVPVRLERRKILSTFPSAEVLEKPIPAFQIVLPHRVTREFFDGYLRSSDSFLQGREFIPVLGTQSQETTILPLLLSPSVVDNDSVIYIMGEVDVVVVTTQQE